MPVIDLTKTDEYREVLQPHVEEHRPLLEENGFDAENDFELCAWLVWHWETDE